MTLCLFGTAFFEGIFMKYDAVIFDLDGTLTDTLEDLKNSVNFAMREFGFPERTTDEVRSFVGNGVKRLIDLSVPENTSEEVSAECLSVFKSFYKDNSLVSTKPYDGIIPMLEKLKKDGVKTAVVTNKMHEAAVDIVNNFSYDFGDINISCCCDFTHNKNHTCCAAGFTGNSAHGVLSHDCVKHCV